MLTENAKNKTLVIVGPTGSGKTGLAVEVARELDGEVISADSRAIYIDMDIGTAKPMPEEMQGIPHYGINLVKPGERFTVYEFQKYCQDKILDIRSRGKLPIIAGGTGLYVDSVVYDYHFSNVVKKTCSDRTEISSDFIMIGINWGKTLLRERLTKRANKIFAQNIKEETKLLAEQYGWDNQAMKSNIYPIVWSYINGEIDEAEAKRLSVLDDWHLARRQMTWFRRNKDIIWLKLDECAEYIYNLYK
ncbi:MAG: tRNA (adenosine(37)-N6)-dimethylallyltransferase MiaA [Candidatus Nomurabacteria bacterium]|jgi:tRNA dimethylallyltransferase|nr:tRNA (adenosine(37)-N6)-dimethylallyltransferase MiaA [Candidatus Nomurabacteria bacterium]